MKIWTVISGVVSTLLVASILTFGLSTEIASAHGPACEKHHKKDDGCSPPGGGGGGGGKDETETVFTVEMLEGDWDSEPGLVTSNGPCGTTEGELNLDVRFPKNCVTVTGVDYLPTEGASLTLNAMALDVRFNKSDMLIFFSSDAIAYPSPQSNESVYVSERLQVTIRGGDGSSFTIVVNDSLNLIKAHQEMKGDLVGPIFIGEIDYTPVE